MKLRYQYRFYPTNQQPQGLAQLFGYVRVVWNDITPKKWTRKLSGDRWFDLVKWVMDTFGWILEMVLRPDRVKSCTKLG